MRWRWTSLQSNAWWSSALIWRILQLLSTFLQPILTQIGTSYGHVYLHLSCLCIATEGSWGRRERTIFECIFAPALSSAHIFSHHKASLSKKWHIHRLSTRKSLSTWWGARMHAYLPIGLHAYYRTAGTRPISMIIIRRPFASLWHSHAYKLSFLHIGLYEIVVYIILFSCHLRESLVCFLSEISTLLYTCAVYLPPFFLDLNSIALYLPPLSLLLHSIVRLTITWPTLLRGI